MSSPPLRRSELPAAAIGPAGIAVSQRGAVHVVSLRGSLRALAEPAHEALSTALIGHHGAVVCDLSGAVAAPTSAADRDALALLASTGAEARAWPATPVGVLCPSAVLRDGLEEHPDSADLVIADRWPRLRSGLSRTSPVVWTQAWLSAGEDPAALLELSGRTLRAWGCGSAVRKAGLVLAAMVAGAVPSAGTGSAGAGGRRGVASGGVSVEIAYDRIASRLRFCVRYDRAGEAAPVPQSQAVGRGLLLVGVLSRSWGLCRSAEDGTVLWAVLAAEPAAAKLPGDREAPGHMLRTPTPLAPADPAADAVVDLFRWSSVSRRSHVARGSRGHR